MEFLKKLPFFPVRKKNQPTRSDGVRRPLRLESLEAREMLAVSLLSSPIAAYAQQDNPVEIRFEISASSNATAQIDFVVKQVNSTLNPSAPVLVSRSTGEILTLTNVVDGTTGSSATALLKSGSYSIFVYADTGQGGLTLDILQEPVAAPAKSGLDVLVAAAISQQQAGWSYRIAYYNGLLQGTDYAGAAGMKPIATLYPEVDVNGDGVVNGADLALAGQSTGGTAAAATVSSVYVVSQDLTAPEITIGLKNDTGTANDGITTDPALVGRITDASGVKSISYNIDGGSSVALSLDSSGTFTILNSTLSNTGLATGTHTVTITAADTKGNTSTSAYTFTLVASAWTENVVGSSVSVGGSATANLSNAASVRSVDGLAISAGRIVTLAQNKGTVALAANGTLTFTPGSNYDRLAEGEKETLGLAIVSGDDYGHTFSSTVSFTVTGQNVLPQLADTTRPNLNVDENGSGTVAASTLLAKWTDPDNGANLSIASVSLSSVSCSDSALTDTFTVAALSRYVTLTSSGVKFDAAGSVFGVLGAGETLTLTVAYTVKDQFGISGDTGHLTFTVFGRNDAPTLTCRQASGFRFVSNSNATTTVSIDPGFTKSDVDRNDAAALIYELDAASKNRGFDIDADGVITIDRTRAADLDGTYTLTVTLRDGHGGSAMQNIAVEFYKVEAPVLDDVTITIGEKSAPVSTNLLDSITKIAGHDYSFSRSPVPTHYSTDGVDWMPMTGSGRDPSGCWNFDPATGLFEFLSGGNFDDLTSGDSIFFKFEYMVSDNGYDNCESTGSLVVKVIGENDPPGRNSGIPTQTVIVTESASAETVKVDDILSDWSDADHAGSDLRITGLRILSVDDASPISTEELRAVAEEFLKIADNGRSVEIDPSHEISRSLGVGQNVTMTLEYTVSDPLDGSGIGVLTLTVNGTNGPPVFTSGMLEPIPATTTVEIDWRRFFSDADRDDRLSLIGIDGTAFGTDRTVSISGLGIFYLDAAERLWFTPDAGFDSLKATEKSDVFNVTLDVEDRQKAKPVADGVISLAITGTDKAPVVVNNFVTNESVENPIVISVEDIASDLNGDALHFHSVRFGDKELVGDAAWNELKHAWILVLDSGTTVMLDSDGKTLTVDGTSRNEFLPIDETEKISLLIAVADERGMVSERKIVTVIFEGVSAKSPTVGEHVIAGVTEDDIEAPPPVNLAEHIDDPNQPGRETDDWYTIDWHGLASARLDEEIWESEFLDELFEGGLWSYENGVLTFKEAPAGHFDFLGRDEILTLDFSYTVTDNTLKTDSNGPLRSDGTISVKITGVNDDPILTGDGDFTVTNSGIGFGTTIPLGRFEATDPDHADRPALSVGSVTGTHDGRALETCPVFTLDEDGNLSMINAGLPELRPGESAVFSVQIHAEDGNGGFAAKTIAVSVYAKHAPEVEVSAITVNEGDFSVSSAISVADVEDPFRTKLRTGNDWYAEPAIFEATVSEKFQTEIIDPASFFAVSGDGIDGYALTFTGSKDDFAFLRLGEELVFSVTIAVVDDEFGVSTTETVNVTVVGKGDRHTVENHVTTFDYRANRREADPTVFDPAYEIADNDWQSTYEYSLADVKIDEMPENIDPDTLKRLIAVDAGTGEITLDERGLAGLATGFKYSLTIRVASVDDGHYVDTLVELTVKIAGAPTVEPVITAIDETQNVTESIVVTPPNDGIDRSADWCVISVPALVGIDFENEKTLPEGFDFAEILAGLASIDDGVFKFETNSRLDLLPEGSALVLTYEFTVTDTEFATETTRSVILTIFGKNNRGTATTLYTVDGVHEAGSSTKHEVHVADIADLVRDVDLGDSHSIMAVDDVGIVHDAWVSVHDKGEFRYVDGSLLYRPSSSVLESLRHAETRVLTFGFTLQDDSGCAATAATEGSFIITVSGTNKSPVIEVDGLESFDEGGTVRIYAEDIATDMNDGDTLRFYEVDGHDEDFRMSDGTTIRFGGGGLWIEIDTSTRYADQNLPAGGVLVHSLDIVIVDDSGAENRYSETRPLLVSIDGVDDAPTMSETHEFGVSLDGLDGVKFRDFVSVGHLDFFDPDTEIGNYVFEIVGDGDLPGFKFDEQYPTWLCFNYRPDTFLEGTYTFTVVARHAGDETVGCETAVTVHLGKTKAPTVEVDYPDDTDKLEIAGTDETGGVEIIVTDPTGERSGDDWYELVNVRVAHWSPAVPPGAANYGIVDGRFIFELNGAYDELRYGETKTLVFEITVRDLEHAVDAVETIVIEIVGVNDSSGTDRGLESMEEILAIA